MKTFILALFALLASVLAACVPAAGQATTVYEAPVSTVLEAVAQVGPQIRPGAEFTPLRVVVRGGDSIVLRASETVGSQVVGALAQSERVTVQVTVTVFPVTATASRVTLRSAPEGNAAAQRAVEGLLLGLEARFQRAF